MSKNSKSIYHTSRKMATHIYNSHMEFYCSADYYDIV